MTPIPPPTHYEILGLPLPLHDEADLTAQTLRAAYRRALLRWHPDKSNTLKSSTKPVHQIRNGISKYEGYSVDQISTAYAVLSDPKERRAYDRGLKAQRLLYGGILGNGANGNGGGDKKFKTGVDVVDLDDLEYDEAEGIWYRGCRCGDERGFEVREHDLEEGGGEGEVVVGCRGCSLWLRLLFGVVEGDDADGLHEEDHAGT